MKHAVVSTGLHDADIRPAPLLSEFKRLSIDSAREYFGDPGARLAVNCPACESADAVPAFEKQGFQYVRCGACESVYVSPRPSRESLKDFYQTSPASRYRVEHFSRETAEARRRHLLRAHAQWMSRLCDELHAPAPGRHLDIGTSSPVLFEELQAIALFESSTTLWPLPGLETEFAGAQVAVAEDGAKGFSAVTAFEQVEHQFSPFDLVREAFDRLAPGGLFFFTTRSISGFDLQVLGGRAPYIFVPEHLNLLSVEGLERLIERSGFRLVELSTPGQLDVELVLRAIADDPSIELPPFADYLLRHRGADAHSDLQELLQKHRLSSHVRVAAQKPAG